MKNIITIILSLTISAVTLASCVTDVNIKSDPNGGTKAPEAPSESVVTSDDTASSGTEEITESVTAGTELTDSEAEPVSSENSAETSDTETSTTETSTSDVYVPGGPVVAPPEGVGDVSFYDDAAFIGDSVTLKLYYYTMNNKKLGNATFLTQGSYSMAHAAWGSMLLKYQGQDMSPEDALAAAGVNKVFIMLGMNDIAAYGIDKTIDHWNMVIGRIREKCPDIGIYIQSCTPILTGAEKGALNNANMDEFNSRLNTFASENGCYFIDVASYMKDSTGGLASVYCSDGYVHLSDAGAETWIKVLVDFASNN